MKYSVIFIFLLGKGESFSQPVDTAKIDNFFFKNPCVYSVLQFPKNDKPQVTTLGWAYTKHLYVEFHHNYEDRKTFSLYLGKSFKLFKNNELEIIPMLGSTVGKLNSLAPAYTIILEANSVRGFSQTQYMVCFERKQGNLLFNWSEILFRIHKPIYLGISNLFSSPELEKSTLYLAPVLSIKKNHFILEGYAYNFWEEMPMWALGIQYNY